MFLSRPPWLAYAYGLAVLGLSNATPVEVSVGRPLDDLMYREALAVAHSLQLEKRVSADFDMGKTWDNDILFKGDWTKSDGDGTEGVSLAITCVKCYTKGTVTATLTDEDIIDPAVRLDFSGVEAYVDIDLSMSAGATYAINLLTTNSPIGLGFPGLSVGVVFYVDLVLSLSEEIDLEGGFYLQVAEGSFLEASVFGGAITKSFFDGLSTKGLPITVRSGSATFKADLRLRVQCGAEAEIDMFGIGAGAELGIYANLVEFVAVLGSTASCELQSLEWFDLNVGAYAHLDVVVDYKTIGPIPTVSTTLLTAPTLTQCWITAGLASPSSVSLPQPPIGGIGLSAGRQTSAVTSSTPSVATSGAPTTSSSCTTATAGPSSFASLPTNNSSSLRYSNASATAAVTSTDSPVTASGSSGGSANEPVTSTVLTTTTFTITSCAASVVNCPASYASEIVATHTFVATPATTAAAAAAAASSTTAHAVLGVEKIIADVIVLVPCSSAIVETFSPPAPPASAASSLQSSATPVMHAVVEGTRTTTITTATTTTTATTASAGRPTDSPFIGGPNREQPQANSSSMAASGTGRTTFSSSSAALAAPALPTAGAGLAAPRSALGVLIAIGGTLLVF